MNPYDREAAEAFEGRHAHVCACGTAYSCCLLACRERVAEPCWPCRLRSDAATVTR